MGCPPSVRTHCRGNRVNCCPLAWPPNIASDRSHNACCRASDSEQLVTRFKDGPAWGKRRAPCWRVILFGYALFDADPCVERRSGESVQSSIPRANYFLSSCVAQVVDLGARCFFHNGFWNALLDFTRRSSFPGACAIWSGFYTPAGHVGRVCNGGASDQFLRR